MPQISVLMPVYNAQKYLGEAIDSIINQSYKNWELILINDGSDDGSEAIIKSYEDTRIKYLKNDFNIGLINTLNKGLEFCSGKYIARMDADDIALKDRLAHQYKFLESNPAYGMCGGDALVIDNNGKETGRIKNVYSNNLLKINLLFSVPFVHPCMMVRREVFERFKYDMEFKHVEDYDLWCRIASEWKVANLPHNLLKYRWHNTNVSVLNETYQAELKNFIIRRELKQIGLEPSEDELYYHTITFQLYSKGSKLNVSVENMEGIKSWFSKLIRRNREVKVYDMSAFVSFLWSRWIVLCLSQKKYVQALFPPFFSYTPKSLWITTKLVLFLSKK